MIFFACRNLSGQTYSFHSYKLGNGIISNNVEAICQDSLGYIWIGTWEGISVYDSKEFHNYSTANGLSLNKILSIIADKQNLGTVWIGTGGGGVDKFENGKFHFFGMKLPPKMENINGLFEDTENRIWCGTDNGFYFIQNDKVHLISLHTKTGAVLSFAQLNKLEILLACEEGIFRYSIQKGILNRINLPDAGETGFVSVIADNDGSIYALSESGILYKKNNYGISKIILGSTPRAMIEDNKGYLWIGTYNGLFKIDKSLFSQKEDQKFTTKTGLDDNNIPSLLFDRENILWVGSNQNGISKLTYQNLLLYKVLPELNSSEWASSAVDLNNHIWIAYNNCLLELWKGEPGNWHIYNHWKAASIRLKNNFCIKIANGLMYISTVDNKIYIFKIEPQNRLLNHGSHLKLKEKIDLEERIKHPHLFKIFVDKSGLIWCSLLDHGVAVLDNSPPRKIVKIYSKNNGLPDNSIRAMFQDNGENFWFGGYDGGLAEFSKDKVLKDLLIKYSGTNIFKRLFTTANGLTDNSVRSIREEKDGSILIGTRYGGLIIYKNGIFKSINKDDGLLSNGIWSINISPDKKIWLATQSGIQELNKDEIPTHDLYEEIPKLPFYAVCSTRDNDLCFAGEHDVYIYQPLKGTTELPPPVYFTHLSINGKEKNIEDNLTLQSNQNTITFEFVGIENREDKNVYYKYMLLNSDKDWNLIRDHNSITYSSLSPGKYAFRVVAVSGRNLQSIHPAVIRFTIKAPFYLQGWFIAITALIIILGFAAFSRMRIKRLIEIEKIRTRIAADLHDEIGSGLTRIAILSEHALSEEKKAAGIDRENITSDGDKYTSLNSIERAGKIARGLVDSMIDVIWSIDPKYDSLHDFVFNFKNFAYEVCEAKGIKLIIETKNIENVKVNSQIKRSLQLITKEALNNSLKYSGCRTIRFLISVKSKSINLIIEDDGIGFDSKSVKNGRGIFNIQKHVKDLFGEFDLQSPQGVGTSLIIKLPVKV